MELELQRKVLSKHSTIGELYVLDGAQRGKFECYILEDPMREVEGEPVEKWKVPGDTAIPVGRYRIVMTYSTRFQRILPLLMGVPGFDGIRIHPGNAPADTEGCLLTGQQMATDSVLLSRKAHIELVAKIGAALNLNQQVWITIKNPTEIPEAA
jgi:hypothetical protein